MTIKVIQNLVPSSKYSIKCPYSMEAEYITIHNTANDASARNEIAYMVQNNNQVSYHFAVDDKEVVQGIPVNRNAWHCGDGGNGTGNRKSIGVEICYSKSGGERYRKAEALAIKFIAQLLRERGWGIERVRTHQQWSGKYCPHRILAEGRLEQVLQAIEKELKGTSTPSKPATSPSSSTSGGTYKVKAGDTLWGIATALKTTVAELKKVNGLTSDLIKVGQTLKIPTKNQPAPKPQPEPTKPSYVGKRVEAKVDLRFYVRPSWADNDVAGICKKGHGFTIVDKVKVGSGEQYKVKNSKGKIYYITASTKYVTVK